MTIPKALSVGEETFAQQCAAYGLKPKREYVFAEGRKYRADFAWPGQKILVEIEGGTWINGRHNRGSSVEADYRKYNLAASQEWLVFRFSTYMIKSGEAIEIIKAAVLA